jgi:hypothetical protein
MAGVDFKLDHLGAVMRECLFHCKGFGPFISCRTMLHAVDGHFVGDPETVGLAGAPEIEALLTHFIGRERAVWFTQVGRSCGDVKMSSLLEYALPFEMIRIGSASSRRGLLLRNPMIRNRKLTGN